MPNLSSAIPTAHARIRWVGVGDPHFLTPPSVALIVTGLSSAAGRESDETECPQPTRWHDTSTWPSALMMSPPTNAVVTFGATVSLLVPHLPQITGRLGMWNRLGRDEVRIELPQEEVALRDTVVQFVLLLLDLGGEVAKDLILR